MNRQRLDSPLVYVGAHNVYYVKLPVKVLYFTIHIHTQINQYVVISDFPPVSVEKFNLCSVMAHHRPCIPHASEYVWVCVGFPVVLVALAIIRRFIHIPFKAHS